MLSEPLMIFQGDVNDLYFDLGNDYTNINICQDPQAMHLRFMRYPVYKLHFSRVLSLLREWGKNTDGYRKCDLQTKWY